MPELRIGTKIVKLSQMTRLAYNLYRNWELPANENGSDKGYLVEYSDGDVANHPSHKGYISWSPEDVADNAYKASGKMTFGMAIEAMKRGYKVARTGWNGLNMFAYLVQGSEFKVNREPLLSIYPEGTDIKYRPHIDLKTADGSIATWSPSGSDALAEDWEIIEGIPT